MTFSFTMNVWLLILFFYFLTLSFYSFIMFLCLINQLTIYRDFQIKKENRINIMIKHDAYQETYVWLVVQKSYMTRISYVKVFFLQILFLIASFGPNTSPSSSYG